jgi:hypothetical protein
VELLFFYEVFVATKTLVDIVSDQMALDELLIERCGDVSDADIETIVSSWIGEISTGIAQKIEGYYRREEFLKTRAATFKERGKRLIDAAKVLDNTVEQLRDRLKYSMIQMDKFELLGTDNRYKLSQSAASVYISDSSKIPEEYLTITVTRIPDKKKIKAALEAGIIIDGASLERGFTLRSFPNGGK